MKNPRKIAMTTGSTGGYTFTTWLGLFCFLPLALSSLYPTEQPALFGSKVLLLLGGCLFFLLSPLKNVVRSVSLAGLAGFSGLSLVWSVSPSSTWYGTIHLLYYVIVFALFRTITVEERSLLWGFRLLAAVSVCLAIEGLYQHLYGYEEYFRYLEGSNELGQEMQQLTQSWLTALSGRIFSRFALPSQLAGFLLLILPLNLFLMIHEKQRWLRILWGSAFALNGIIFFYTKSFGAWLSALCVMMLAAAILVAGRRSFSWSLVLKSSTLFLLTTVSVFSAIGWIRGQYLWDFHGNNPLWYRLLNWKTALAILRDHPFWGTGWWTFGKMYPLYMQPGANESQYVHNTYLQVFSDLGFFGGLLLLWLVGNWVVFSLKRVTMLCEPSVSRSWRAQIAALPAGAYCVLSGAGFLLHNVIDFDFYVFPLGVLGIALLALTLNLLDVQSHDEHVGTSVYSGRNSWGTAVRLVLVIGLVAGCWHDWRAVSADMLHRTAVSFIQQGSYQRALPPIQRARALMPDAADYCVVEGSILSALEHDTEALERFRAAFKTELRTPGVHAGLSEVFLKERNLSLAYAESRWAAELFPQRMAYQTRAREIRNALTEFDEQTR